MATTLRFVILGDDRASASFNKFARNVDKANGAVDRNSKALRSQGAAAGVAENGLVQLIGAVSGFGDAQDVASKKTSTFAKGLAAVNLATGVLEPVMAGVVVAAGGLAAAFTSAAAGAVAYGVALKPLLSETSDVMKAQEALDKARTTAEINYRAALKSGVPVKTAAAAKQRALTAAQQQYNAAVKDTPKAVRQFAKDVTAAQDAWTSWANKLAKPVLRPLELGLSFVHRALSAIRPLVKAAAGAISQLVGELGLKIQGGGLERIVTTILPHVKPTILDLGHAIGNVTSGIFGVLKAFLPVSGSITGGVVHLTKLFKDWANSLPSHSGFQSLMNMFRQQTPQAVAVLKNLAAIIANVARATVGLASPANSKALLNILQPLTQIIAQLSQNQALVRTVLYFLLLRKTVMSLAPAFLALKAGYAVVTGAVAVFRSASAAAVVLRARTIAVAVATRIWAAAQFLLDAALDANPIGLIVIALAALGAALVVAWNKSKTFRTIVIAAWNGVKDTAVAVINWFKGPFVRFFTQTIPHVFKTVVDWVKHNWPYLLGALTGPIGLAIVWIIKHWTQFRQFLVRIYNTIRRDIASAWDVIWRNTVTRVRNGINDVVNFFQKLPGRALAALRGLGSHLYAFARAALNDFWRGLKSIAGSVFSWVGNFVKTIWNKVKAFFGISSPSSLFYDIGKNLMLGLFHGIKDHAHHAQNAMGGAVGALGGPTSASASQAQAYARSRLSAYGWGAGQMTPLILLWNQESGWNHLARNPSSGAYGIPQALPPGKMGAAANPPMSSAAAQINWGLGYIKGRYGSPAGAWAHEQAFNWYGSGFHGWFDKPTLIGVGERGRERVDITPRGQRGPGSVVYNISVAVPVGANAAAVGREIVQKIKQYEESSGTGWRR